MNLDPVDPRDLPRIASLLGRTRARGGLSHPGGTQWWLRELGQDGFEAFVSRDGGEANAFVLMDADQFALIESEPPGPAAVELALWAADLVRDEGHLPLRLHVEQAGPLEAELMAHGFMRGGNRVAELELLYDIDGEPSPAQLPSGYRLSDLTEVSDEAYVAVHRAAWSDRRPSRYDRARHSAVKAMPQFDPELVSIALGPDGTPAACCIVWCDARSRTAEIEPLGTHRDFRRLGLADALVRESFRRAWRNGAERVLVWNDPVANPAAYGLYTGAGMTARRRLVELTGPA